MTVGATGRAGLPSDFSSSSAAVDLAAPGEDLPFQDRGSPDSYEVQTGTSFAAPIVSAAAAWIRTVRGSMSPTQLADLLRSTARDIDTPGFDARTGFGLLDIPAALAAPLPAADPQEPNDDVRQVVAGGLFAQPKPLVSPRFRAGLDLTEDPSDVYRVAVPKGRSLTVKVTPTADVRVALFGPAARTVGGTRARLALSDRPGAAVETATYANRGRGAVVVYLHVRPTSRGAVAQPAVHGRAHARARSRVAVTAAYSTGGSSTTSGLRTRTSTRSTGKRESSSSATAVASASSSL